MRVAEIYHSLQGEGILTGMASAFVRTSGCNLRCWYCDTPYASWQPEGNDFGVDEILEQLAAIDAQHVVLTGGEPMLWAELIPLTTSLQSLGRHITIETAGTLYLPVACDLMSISPKLANSTPSIEQAGLWNRRHERVRNAPEVMRRLVDEYAYQVKFVIDSPADCDEMEQYLEQFPTIDRGRVFLMPQGTQQEELVERGYWLESYCQQQGLQFCPRRQVEWFGLARGT